MTTATHDGGPMLDLPSTGPDPLPFDTALAAVLGYARGRRPFWFRSPDFPRGHWVQLPAFGWPRFDTRPAGASDDIDILISEGLHGRLDRPGWGDVHDALARVRPLFDAVVEHAGGRAFWELTEEELSVLGEPGTVGSGLREIGRRAGQHPAHVFAALHHRRPDLVPHLTRSTRRALLPHGEEGDSDVGAVILRELRANDTAFGVLERTSVALLRDACPTRLRLHDILLWLTTTLRMTHAVALGRATEEWRVHDAASRVST
ncbi:MAG: hypothetical protein L0I76_22160 [Pseudonocardia sp.]|nr:hypothetical protein [Pseudonocardia sp.]